MNEVTGKLINKADIFISDSGTFTKQEIVLELVSGEYTNVAVLEGVQDMVQTLGSFNLGDEVKCTFFFNGRNEAWKGRYFNSLKINSIKLVGQQPEQAAPPEAAAPPVTEHQTTALPQTKDVFPPMTAGTLEEPPF